MPRDDDLEEVQGLVDIYGQYKKKKSEAEKARLEVQLWWQQARLAFFKFHDCRLVWSLFMTRM